MRISGAGVMEVVVVVVVVVVDITAEKDVVVVIIKVEAGVDIVMVVAVAAMMVDMGAHGAGEAEVDGDHVARGTNVLSLAMCFASTIRFIDIEHTV